MDDDSPDFNRRNFLKNASLATLMAMAGGVELRAETASNSAAAAATTLTDIPAGPTVRFGVVGLGSWGREILKGLSQITGAKGDDKEFNYAPVVAICDNYHSSLHKASANLPKAQQFEDFQKLLECKDVDAVVIATPTPVHTEMVVAALQAGKHVYCEAPLATTIAEAKVIAKAARDAVKLVFQPGLQERSHPERQFLLPFIRAGSLGEMVMARAQSHRSTSWISPSSNPAHMKELNWRLHSATSTGLMGEIGIHQIDAISWFLKARPTAITGFGSINHWKDDGAGGARDVADTVQGVFEYPGGVRFMYDATLCNSFDKDYEMYYGTQSAVMVRDGKAWLFKEPDAELLGWEVYAKKDTFYTETGIALTANASKQTSIGTSATAGTANAAAVALNHALKAFTDNVGKLSETVNNIVSLFGDDPQSLKDGLKDFKPYAAAANWRDGLDATILAIKANEAVVKQQKVTLENDLFEI